MNIKIRKKKIIIIAKQWKRDINEIERGILEKKKKKMEILGYFGKRKIWDKTNYKSMRSTFSKPTNLKRER